MKASKKDCSIDGKLEVVMAEHKRCNFLKLIHLIIVYVFDIVKTKKTAVEDLR